MLFASNGTKLYIGAAMADPGRDLTVDDFEDTIWAKVGETENLGTAGDAAAEITFDGIDSNRTKRLKGTRNAGTMDVVCGLDYSDAGQLALIAAEKTAHDYPIRLVFNDAPVGGTPSERMFIAKVASAAEAVDAANNVLKLLASLWVNSNVVKINAAPAGGP